MNSRTRSLKKKSSKPVISRNTSMGRWFNAQKNGPGLMEGYASKTTPMPKSYHKKVAEILKGNKKQKPTQSNTKTTKSKKTTIDFFKNTPKGRWFAAQNPIGDFSGWASKYSSVKGKKKKSKKRAKKRV